MIECDAKISPKCKKWYHRLCENVEKIYFDKKNKRKSDRSKLYWECAACFKIIQIKWAPTVSKNRRVYKIENSCTIDPFLMAFYVQSKYHPSFLNQVSFNIDTFFVIKCVTFILLQLPLEMKPLIKCMELALQNKFQEAQLSWALHLREMHKIPAAKFIETDKKTHIDLYGSVEEFFLNSIRSLTKMTRKSECSNNDCPQRISNQLFYTLTLK